MPEIPVIFRPSSERPKPFVIAHRGNSAKAPENTLAAFKLALAEGADILETDLHPTRDGIFACIHDGSIDRTTDGSGAVAELTMAEIQSHSASYGRAGFEAERVPTLAELLAILPARVGLLLELKSDRFLEEDVARRLAAELREAGVADRTAFISFHLERVLSLHRVAPEILTGFITATKPHPNVPVTLVGPFWPLLLLNPAYTFWAHRRSQFVAPLDITPHRRLWLYKLLRCDAVLANDPGSVLAALGRGAPEPALS